jgi:hypothetical protein
VADEFQMLDASRTMHARMAERTARKEEWRKHRAGAKNSRPLEPPRNDRPEVGCEQ